MFHHVVLLKFAGDTPAETVATFTDALRALPASIPEIRSYSVGSGVNDGNWSFGIAAAFDSPKGWATYDTHPVHNEARASIAAHIIDRSAAQFWSDSAPQA